MNIKKFIESVKASLNIETFEKKGKKKSVKRLLEKLRSRKERLKNVPKKRLPKKELKELEEELTIISLQIKPKGAYQTTDYAQDDVPLHNLEGWWVNQTTDGGYTGDEFAGTVSVKISKDKYLQFSYSM